MRQDQQTDDDAHPGAKSDPVPPPGQDAAYDHERPLRDEEHDGRNDDERAVDGTTVDRDTSDDPAPADGRTDQARVDEETQAYDEDRVDDAVDHDLERDRDPEDGRDRTGARVDTSHDDSGFGQGRTDTDRDVADEDATTGLARTPDDAGADLPPTDPDPNRDYSVDRAEAARDDVVEPAAQLTTFGAGTVGGAAAAAAMAGQDRADRHDVRDEETVQVGDGSVDDRAGGRAGEVAPAGDLMPGEVPAEAATTLFAADRAQGFRERWREVQLNFVDDPRAAAGDAQRLVEEALDALSAAVAEQKNKLGGWDSGDAGDTENLRMVVRRYRDFLDRVLGL